MVLKKQQEVWDLLILRNTDMVCEREYSVWAAII
jgi:hypothetical protein